MSVRRAPQNSPVLHSLATRHRFACDSSAKTVPHENGTSSARLNIHDHDARPLRDHTTSARASSALQKRVLEPRAEARDDAGPFELRQVTAFPINPNPKRSKQGKARDSCDLFRDLAPASQSADCTYGYPSARSASTALLRGGSFARLLLRVLVCVYELLELRFRVSRFTHVDHPAELSALAIFARQDSNQ